ncbi:Crp/Fnr family transcriptional regulator [Tsuneonella amylolytica]|uniref:Crp/Fnr family transcriptional regulator n=1 Tax=Tsuneonella amylolytica TaxID=2338327 RepID=UPI001F3D9941|nr:Crp/Fnr family transcriptional regulator [Tsuneonella amylolytica]
MTSPDTMVETVCPKTWMFLKGRARHALSPEERATIENMIGDVERLDHNHTILKAGTLASRSTILLEGWIARMVWRDGRRHIVSLQVPGDFVDLHAFALKRVDHDVVAIGPAKVGYVAHDKLEEVIARQPHIGRLLWFASALEAAIHREWILTMEHLALDGRFAHFLCEMWHRLNFVGLAEEDGYAMPLTQVEMADACGTTPVHLNRIVRQLREAEIVTLSRGRVTIHDRARLEDTAKFDPRYLYGEGPLKLGDELTRE